MKKAWRILGVLFVSCGVQATASGQGVIFSTFPKHRDIGILCWSVPDQASGYLSGIVVVQTDRDGNSTVLWDSHVDNSYSPQIRVVPEIQVHGLPLVLVKRQTGAASSELDVIGKTAASFRQLFHVDGFKFDVAPLEGSKLPSIIAHRDASILDVPHIYRWNGGRFVESSDSHPMYYQKLLTHDKKSLPTNPSAAVLVNLAQIALLSGDRAASTKILDEALVRERNKGPAANPEMLHRIARALRTTARSSH